MFCVRYLSDEETCDARYTSFRMHAPMAQQRPIFIDGLGPSRRGWHGAHVFLNAFVCRSHTIIGFRDHHNFSPLTHTLPGRRVRKASCRKYPDPDTQCNKMLLATEWRCLWRATNGEQKKGRKQCERRRQKCAIFLVSLAIGWDLRCEVYKYFISPANSHVRPLRRQPARAKKDWNLCSSSLNLIYFSRPESQATSASVRTTPTTAWNIFFFIKFWCILWYAFRFSTILWFCRIFETIV